MGHLETDYLVVGAGASGMAFVDTLIEQADVDVVMVDRRHRPGGHWLDAYPFVRLHQPSASYGVGSRALGHDKIDETGPNAGYYERATAAEICDYFDRVMDEHLLASNKVRFFSMSNYLGEDADGHHFVSLMTGERTTVTVRRRIVDATYVESSIPSRHTPKFQVDDDVRFIPPNDLVHLNEPASGYTIVGAGKTSMDTCVWLMDTGVAPDRIRWIRPRDPWAFNRASMQPLDKVGSYMHLQGCWVRAAAEADNAADFFHRLESDGIMLRIDAAVEPQMFRGPFLSELEIDALRRIENVVRMGKVQRISTAGVTMTDGSISGDAREVYVDCTASGIATSEGRPIYEPGRITLQYSTIGNVPSGGAIVGAVEALRDDDAEKNRLVPVIEWSGNAADVLDIALAGMNGLMARGAEPDIAKWFDASRLNMSRGVNDHLDDPRIGEAFGIIGAHIGPAMENLERLVRAKTSV